MNVVGQPFLYNPDDLNLMHILENLNSNTAASVEQGQKAISRYFMRKDAIAPSDVTINLVWMFNVRARGYRQDSFESQLLFSDIQMAWPVSRSIRAHTTWLLHLKLDGALNDIRNNQWKLKMTNSGERCAVTIKAKCGILQNGDTVTEILFEIHSHIPPTPARIGFLLTGMLGKAGYGPTSLPWITAMKLSVQTTYRTKTNSVPRMGDSVCIQYAPRKDPNMGSGQMEEYLRDTYTQYFSRACQRNYDASYAEQFSYHTFFGERVFEVSCPCNREECPGGVRFEYNPCCFYA